MRILELCNFSAGVCGVWARVREESIRLAKLGYEVKVFSSNSVKGSDEIAKPEESINDVKIKRYPFIKLGGESFMHWFGKSAQREALEYKPDVIIAHNYRQLHTTKALKIAKRLKKQGLKCKVFLVTHAPFVEGDITRSFLAKKAVWFYDKFIGKKTLKKFDKIVVISQWEIPFLEKSGADKNKTIYIPNGIPEEFFTQKISKEENKILFLGRISPKKKIETIIKAMALIKDKKTILEIVGPQEKGYFEMLESLVKSLNISNRVKFSYPIFDIANKIKKIDSARIFILPSRVEGMPQSLIEAMAREKIVIGSDSIAIRDLIKDGKNGYLFEFDNPQDLARKIDAALSSNNKNIKKEARKFVEKFSWNKIIFKIENIIIETNKR